MIVFPPNQTELLYDFWFLGFVHLLVVHPLCFYHIPEWLFGGCSQGKGVNPN